MVGACRTGYLPARRRWMRVFLSSLRCFFFAIRLRRFLMTEPTLWTSRRKTSGPVDRPSTRA